MPAVKTPRRGSLAYWPRKRTSRIYPSLTSYPETDKPKVMGFAGYKAGMLNVVIMDNRKESRTFGLEVSMPVTVIESPPLKVIGIRTYANTPKGLKVLSEAVVKEVPKELSRKIKVGDFKTDEKLASIEKNFDKVGEVRLVVSTQPNKTGVKKDKPELFELPIGGTNAKEKYDFAKSILNKEFSAKDFVREGELVDVVAVTKGKGTAGPVKRFGIKIQVRHAKKKRRHVGSLGQERPGKVRHTVPQAGQLGFFRRTEFNKRILKIGESDITPKEGFHRYGVVKGDFILIEGSVPGSLKRLVMMRPAIRPNKLKFYLPEIKEIVR